MEQDITVTLSFTYRADVKPVDQDGYVVIVPAFEAGKERNEGDEIDGKTVEEALADAYLKLGWNLASRILNGQPIPRSDRLQRISGD